MLFDDSIELDEIADPPTCVAVPLKSHISLKDIWVPAGLLVNRKKAFDSYRNTCNVLHTLSRPDVESLSVYYEDSEVDLDNAKIQTKELTSTSQTNLTSCFSSADESDIYYSDEEVEVLNDNEEQMPKEPVAKPQISHLRPENGEFHSEEKECDDSAAKCPNKALKDFLTVYPQPTNEECNNEAVCGDSLTQQSIEAVEELPIAYQRPALQNIPSRHKSKKEKKKKNSKKNLQLGDFLQTENLDGYEIPKRDEFFDNLVRQGKCFPIIQENNVVDNSCLYRPTEMKFLGTSKQSIFSLETSSLFSKHCDESVVEPSVTDVTEKNNLQLDPVEQEPTNEIVCTTLVLENIAKDITRENIENLMSGFGELKNISLKPNGKSVKAYVEFGLLPDVEWIIDCLDGTQPFGASCGVLKCYKL